MANDTVATFCGALWRRDAKTIAKLSRVVDPNGRDRFGYTPLLMAAQYGDLSIVSLLVERGSEVNQGRVHLTPITLAASRGAKDIVKFLREHGAAESILTAIYLGEVKKVERALKKDSALATLRDELNVPILHHCVASMQPEMVTIFLDHGATVGDVNANQETALHQCADARQAPPGPAATIATLLLDRGANPNARNWDDVTPLHQAVRARNLAVVEILLARGADPNARDKSRGSTPLRRSVSSTGASGTSGTAALMLPLVKILLHHGADPDALDKRSIPVRDSARDPAIRDLLDQHHRKESPPRLARANPAKRSKPTTRGRSRS